MPESIGHDTTRGDVIAEAETARKSDQVRLRDQVRAVDQRIEMNKFAARASQRERVRQLTVTVGTGGADDQAGRWHDHDSTTRTPHRNVSTIHVALPLSSTPRRTFVT